MSPAHPFTLCEYFFVLDSTGTAYMMGIFESVSSNDLDVLLDEF
jgi:hypothetical protein